jgi:phosphohistidine phosphatase SixA
MRLRQLRHGEAAVPEGFQHVAPRRIGQRGKHFVENFGLILNHKVKY